MNMTCISYVWAGNVLLYHECFESFVLIYIFGVLSAVRSAKFIPSKHWIVVGSDDGYLRVFDYGTSKKVHEFKAHEDYIRCVEVHPTLSCILTASDDKLIKLWDWEKDWTCCRTFEGHSHYVMHLALNPKDSDSFASASLDGNLKVEFLPIPFIQIRLQYCCLEFPKRKVQRDPGYLFYYD